MFIGGVFVLVLVGVVLLERTRGSRELARVMERLRTADVGLNLANAVTNSVPEQENAAIALLAITNELRSFSLPEDVGPIPIMKFATPGEAQSFVRSESWPGTKGEAFRWDRLEHTHAEALLLFEKLSEISKRPRFASPLDLSKGVADMDIPSLAALPSVMRVLRLVAMCELHKGNDERAAEAVITLLNVFANKSEDQWNIAELVRRSYSRLAFALTWELLQNANIPDETWARLQAAWERCDFVGSYAEAAEKEIAGVSDYFVRVKNSDA